MAYSATNLQLISPGVPKLWLYKSTDANAVAIASGYFTGETRFSVGDMVYCVLTTGGTVESTLITITAIATVTSSDNATST